MEIHEFAARLHALGNETRLEIFRILVRAGADGLPVGSVQKRTQVPHSTLSHHLRKLIAVGLVRQRREGTTLYCCVEYSAMDETLGFLRDECCVDATQHHDSAA